MAKRKKYPKLPNGYGSIRYIGSKRRNCYAVHPPATIDDYGKIIRPKPLCYVDNWTKGFAVLTAYKAGTYTPGMEASMNIEETSDLKGLAQRVLADYNRVKGIEESPKSKTFAEVYESYYDWKYNGKKQLSIASQRSTAAAFKNCSPLHDRIYTNISYQEMQRVIDECSLKHASLELMVSLLKQMAKYARAEGIIEDLSSVELLRININDDDEHGIPFSDDELKILWKNKTDPIAGALLIMCYSGYRISAYPSMKVDTTEWFFQGGVKTAAGKNRIVPIHTCIRELVSRRTADKPLLGMSPDVFRRRLPETLKTLGISNHTPHDCRHTFSRLCEKYDVKESDRKRMLGHSFGADITNGVYGHRTLEELRVEIEKIKCD